MNLAGTLSFPVANALKQLDIPFIFTTSYGRSALPPEMDTTPVLSKPVQPAATDRRVGGPEAGSPPAAPGIVTERPLAHLNEAIVRAAANAGVFRLTVLRP